MKGSPSKISLIKLDVLLSLKRSVLGTMVHTLFFWGTTCHDALSNKGIVNRKEVIISLVTIVAMYGCLEEGLVFGKEGYIIGNSGQNALWWSTTNHR